MEGEQTWPTKEEIADAERAALLQKVKFIVLFHAHDGAVYKLVRLWMMRSIRQQTTSMVLNYNDLNFSVVSDRTSITAFLRFVFVL